MAKVEMCEGVFSEANFDFENFLLIFIPKFHVLKIEKRTLVLKF